MAYLRCSPSSCLLPRLRPRASCCAALLPAQPALGVLTELRRREKFGRTLSAGGSRTALWRLRTGPTCCPRLESPLYQATLSLVSFLPTNGLIQREIQRWMTRRRSSPAREWELAALATFARVSAAVYHVHFVCADFHLLCALSAVLSRSTGHLDARAYTLMRLPHASCDACTRPRGSSRHITCGDIFACRPHESLRAHCNKPRCVVTCSLGEQGVERCSAYRLPFRASQAADIRRSGTVRRPRSSATMLLT